MWSWRSMLAGVALLACAIRLIHASALSNAPVFAVLLGDSKRYVEWGAEIARGDWLGTQAFYQAPLYPYALAILFKAFGVSAEIVRVAQAFVGAAACVLVVMAARLFFDWRAGLVAGLALALYPPAIFFDGHIQKASLDLLFMAALLVAVGGYQHERRNRWLVLLGISLGCLILNRENARLLFPVLAVWLVIWNHDMPIRRRVQAVGVFTLATLLPIAPVAARNYYVAGELLMSTSQFGPNFYIGNHRGASGVYEPLLPDRASVIYEQEDAVRLAADALGRPLSPSEVSSYWVSTTVGEIQRDPVAWMQLMVRKLLLAINTVEAMDTESLEFHAAYSPVLRILSPLTFGVLLPLAIFGVAITASNFRPLAILYGIALFFIVSVVVFFVLARYRYPVVPVLVLFAAAAVVRMRTVWRERRNRVLVGVACALATTVVVNTPMRATSDETSANFGTELLRLERPGEAIPLLLTAVELVPGDAALHRDLAMAYLKAGEPAPALREYTRVVQLQPDSAANHRERAMAAEAAGDTATALSSLNEARRLEPASLVTHTRLGDLLMRMGKPSEARQVYQGALTLDATNPMDVVGLRVRIASLDASEGRIDEALSGLRDAAATARSSGQLSTAAEVEATIEALSSRLKQATHPR